MHIYGYCDSVCRKLLNDNDGMVLRFQDGSFRRKLYIAFNCIKIRIILESWCKGHEVIWKNTGCKMLPDIKVPIESLFPTKENRPLYWGTQWNDKLQWVCRERKLKGFRVGCLCFDKEQIRRIAENQCETGSECGVAIDVKQLE